MKHQRIQAAAFYLLLLIAFCLQREIVSAQTLQAELVTRQQSNSLAYERYLLIKQVDSTGKIYLIDSTEILSFILNYEFIVQDQNLYEFSALSGEAFIPSITKAKVEDNKIVFIKKLVLEKLDQYNCICRFNRPGFATIDCNTKRVIVDLSDLTISAIIPYKTE